MTSMEDGSDATQTSATGTSSAAAFGPYRLLRKLGEGGMGEVWLAEQVRPVHRQVALKIIKAGMDTAQVIARFEAERQALAMMDHPAIATVFDGGSTPEGRPYFAMEYVKGEPLAAYCDRFRMPVSDRLHLFIHVCEGVQHAHQKGIIHRDLKPSNLLVTLVDGKPVVKIIDFGVAKATTRTLTDLTLFTELGALIGTPEYMSPEQADLTGLDIDTRSDVYALGVVLYELLTGTLPLGRQDLRAEGLEALRRAIREVDPPRPSVRVTRLGTDALEVAKNRQADPARLAAHLRGELDWITMKTLEKDRTRRYETVNGLATDVRRYLQHEPVAAGPPGGWYRARKFVRRHRLGVSLAVASSLVLAVFGVTMAAQAQRVARERDRANQEALVSRQVSDFLVALFNVSDPGEARGNSLTAREVLDRGAEKIEKALSEQPELQARLAFTIGRVYNGLGLYAKAESLLLPAIATERRLLGDGHPETLRTLAELANSHWYQARFAQAATLYQEIVTRRTDALGPDHPDTLRANFDLASAYVGENRLADAETLMVATLERQKKVLGPAHSDTLDSLNNLGNLYFRQKRYPAAVQVSLEVLEGTRQARGDDHPDTLSSMHNLAGGYDAVGEIDKAEALYLEVIRKKRKVLGQNHPDLAFTMSRLARVYTNSERFDRSEELLLEAYQIFHAAFGDQNARTQATIGGLVDLYTAWGKANQAAAWKAKRQ